MSRGWICIAENSEHVGEALRDLLVEQRYRVDTFAGGNAVLRALDGWRDGLPDLLVLDADGPGTEGLDLLRRVRAGWPAQAVVVTSAFPSVRAAVAAVQAGAVDYLVKPVAAEALLDLADQVVERGRLVAENQALKAQIRRRFDPDQVVFASAAFRRVVEMAKRVAASDASVLIQGESGTGKELVASTIHYGSRRREQRFLTINCAALTDTLLESQLFGHVKGAFTGAVSSQRGLLEEADGGTLFLDEIGDVSPALQAKLLRVLQEKEFIPVGSTRARHADVRFVAATNKDLEQEVAAGRFREDLFYRLNVVTLQVPPLRERTDDILPLAEFFLGRCGGRDRQLHPEAAKRLVAYPWPGNVRELENVIEMAVILAPGNEIDVDDLPGKLTAVQREAFALPEEPLSLGQLESQYIEHVLRQTRYHKANTARILGISRSTLDRKLAQYEIGKEE